MTPSPTPTTVSHTTHSHARQSDSLQHFFAPCPRGLELALQEELADLGLGPIQVTPGGISWQGPFTDIYYANLHSRIASRILWQVTSNSYRTEEDIYRIVKAIAWDRYFPVTHSLRIDVVATHSPLRSLKFTTLRVKDAICDYFRSVCQERPNIDKAKPDGRVHVWLNKNQIIIYLDTSGDALFKRGYRIASVAAPIRENLAAGILRLIQWNPSQPLHDPMCGSGTFLIEAAHIALGIPSGSRREFGFSRLLNFDSRAWQKIKNTPLKSSELYRNTKIQISGSDHSPTALLACQHNLRTISQESNIDLERIIHLEKQDFLQAPAPSISPSTSPLKGVLICNPPYGARLDDTSTQPSDPPPQHKYSRGQKTVPQTRPQPTIRPNTQIYSDEMSDQTSAEIGKILKKHYAGWNCYFIHPDKNWDRHLRLTSSRKTPLMNGDIECRLFEFRMVAGSNRSPKPKSE